MPADNWTTIWKSPQSKFRRKKKAHFITGFFLKQNKSSSQLRLIQWLKSCKDQRAFYANISLWHLAIDLKKFLKKINKRIKKQYKKCP
jgi:hypothetical protein